jgi:hypothetical protein
MSMTTYDLSGRRRPTGRTWLALAVAAIAVLVLLGMIAVACNAVSPAVSPGGEPGALDGGATSSGPAGGDGSGGTPGPGGQDGGGEPGDGGSGENGSDGGGSDDGGGSGPQPVEPAAEDCVGYQAENLTVTASGGAWLLWDGSHRMKLFATEVDADRAAVEVRKWRQLCFIGRGNDRPDRSRYIVHYFNEPSGLPFGLAPATSDCISYDPPNLGVSEHAGSWWLLDGPAELLPLDNQADAERARLVAGGFTKLCFIGRGNDRPDPDRYILTYWQS